MDREFQFYDSKGVLEVGGADGGTTMETNLMLLSFCLTMIMVNFIRILTQ
jgi:hypothetical protein